MTTTLTSTINELDLKSIAASARETALANELSIEHIKPAKGTDRRRLPRLAFLFESQGLTEYRRNSSEFRSHFYSAMACWCAIASEVDAPITPGKTSVSIYQIINKELALEPLEPNLSIAFHLGVSGLLAERSAETRLHLKKLDISTSSYGGDWLKTVFNNIASAFALLVRKSNGWSDIQQALSAIEQLKNDQRKYEDQYLDQITDRDNQTKEALVLLGFYNLAQMTITVAEYLKSGAEGHTEVGLRLDRYKRQATEAFTTASEIPKTRFAELLWAGCKELIRNSLWNHLEALPEGVRNFGEVLIGDRPDPVLELWPSQQEALRRSFLDPYQRAVMVEMPTSAGKTLLAKFAIAQTKAFASTSTIAYIVPTRALVNQITLDLRQDFSPLGYQIEQAVPAFELDPTESMLLSGKLDILVTTPEKLDLLIRADHPVTKDISLVIADEAHNLQDDNRGARLELLLGTIKREKRNTRFLLLSPFLPNGKELLTWLGEERTLPPIQINWKPNSRIVGSITAKGRESKRKLVLEVLPAADNSAIAEGTILSIGSKDSVPESLTIGRLSKAATLALMERGGILVLCRGKGTAMKRAKEIADSLPPITEESDLRDAVCEYLIAEAGYESTLVKCLKHGVAYHHAGLSHESRWLIEKLIRAKAVKIICGTTTLAQGVNFPISTVIVETLQKGDKKLSYADFWNIAGRAGRTLVDSLGVIAFPSPSAKKREEYVKFLAGEAKEIASQLTHLLAAAEAIGEDFNLAALRNWPQLSSLLQFLAHAVRVADNVDMADEMESLLRSSLIYHQASKSEQNPALDRFINLCRSYVRQIEAGKKGLLALADTTGFATPSVLYLVAKTSEEYKDLKDIDGWNPASLFSDDISGLSKRIDLVSQIPEMRLSDGQGGPLDADRVARIIRDWVNGESLLELAKRHPKPNEDSAEGVDNTDQQVAEFSSYLFSTLITNASWGIGALEGLCLAGGADEASGSAAHVPSMIYFGVQSTEAVWLRMAGLPRIVAEGAASLWREQNMKTPNSYNELRGWISNIDEKDWKKIIPSSSKITEKSMRIIWKELNGSTQ
ncbi:DEAD/DEAH box helicase [Pseudomonas guariconensis]|uniref:DEAD/DEAH box helicase n=1 Tax=Pseudomonas guariconensis TaxID=1288410 RepID=A0AAX0W1X8_9PSED|nr:DEAD/DEAH box helicase [Pseudomonas guariconensis]PLV21023.1 hypothetical protein CXG49_00275 [Pseudomonas guariconensis]PLV25901.1 hypothetical protein CXG53_00275 [Pseudomonas guariconensis]PLV30978.1 hypothetical protein CXG51_00275 [Pseudomonas guariconensis]